MDTAEINQDNTFEGWNETFAHHWERLNGREQTEFFARLSVFALPPPLRQLIQNQALEILDWGCAMGDALPVFAEAFPHSALSGLDISTVAVARAREKYPDLNFSNTSLKEQNRPYSVVYTSNCLEHFAQPLELLRNEILPWVKDYLMILVPYIELQRSPGHLVTFDAASFPARLEEMGMIFWRAISTTHLPQTGWDGQQMLVVYANRQAAGIQELIPALMQWEAAGGKLGT